MILEEVLVMKQGNKMMNVLGSVPEEENEQTSFDLSVQRATDEILT